MEHESGFDLELEKAIGKIKQENARLVCVQLPDGLKPVAGKIAKEIEMQTNAKVIIWLGSCFGSCDIPSGIEKFNIDLLIQWGHSRWRQ